MKHIIFIKDMSCEHCVARIKQGMEDAGIECEVNLATKSVSLKKDGDIVTSARRIITELGFTIL